LGRATVDLLVANPPYATGAERARAAPELSYEPLAALEGGDVDGLATFRRLVGDAQRVLCDGGHLVSEIGAGQGAAARAICARAGFVDGKVLQDLAGLDRVVVAEWRVITSRD